MPPTVGSATIATARTARDRLSFTLPRSREADRPPEQRGLMRDHVRLLVSRPGIVTHTRFDHLPGHVRPGDLVVVNTSPTMPGALDGRRSMTGTPVVVHLSTRHDDDSWEVELRRPDGRGPVREATAGEVIALDAGGHLRLDRGIPGGADSPGHRLWHASLALPRDVDTHLGAYGRPIAYAHDRSTFPLAAHQTTFAPLVPRLGSGDVVRHGASAEMASAGRPFSPLLVTELVRRGVAVAPITLHAGVSSLEDHEPPRPEPRDVPAATADLVNATRRRGGRVVAVGTTVTRALESATDPEGHVRAVHGWTDLVLGPDRPARVVDALVTGWHDAGASHLLLLEAVVGRAQVERAYRSALAGPYLWHEFGDSCLFLPD